MTILTLFSFVLGMGGLRQIMILYIPLLLTAVFLSIHRAAPDSISMTVPRLDQNGARFLLGSVLATCGALAGWQLNTHVLRHIYHYTSQEGVKFTPYNSDRVDTLIQGWLESFGYRGYGYITEKPLLYNAFCFLAILVLVCAFISLIRRPQSYTFPEKVIFLLGGFGFLTYNALYLFTDTVYYTRYNIPTAILLIPICVIYLYRLPRCRLWRGAFFGVLTGLMLWCSCDYYEELWSVNQTADYEQAVAAIQGAGYYEGYATFWNANVMTELTNGALDIRVWNPGQTLEDPDNLYEWLQTTSHIGTHPEGPVFIFVHKDELSSVLADHTLTEGYTLYESDQYIAYGYPSYDAMRTDFYD